MNPPFGNSSQDLYEAIKNIDFLAEDWHYDDEDLPHVDDPNGLNFFVGSVSLSEDFYVNQK